MNKKKILSIIALVLIVALFVGATIYLLPFFAELLEEQNRLAFQAYIDSLGWLGVLVILGIQVLQIILAFIPGEPIEVIAGFMYGPIGGLLICLVGIVIGSTLVFFLVSKLGVPFIKLFFKEEKLKQYEFLQNPQKVDFMTFILFFIPGTPKDLLTYVAPLTPIKMSRFILIATFARIPSVVSSTIAGSAIGDGQFALSIFVFAITGIIALFGIRYNNKLMNKYNEEAANGKQDQA